MRFLRKTLGQIALMYSFYTRRLVFGLRHVYVVIVENVLLKIYFFIHTN